MTIGNTFRMLLLSGLNFVPVTMHQFHNILFSAIHFLGRANFLTFFCLLGTQVVIPCSILSKTENQTSSISFTLEEIHSLFVVYVEVLHTEDLSKWVKSYREVTKIQRRVGEAQKNIKSWETNYVPDGIKVQEIQGP